MATKTMTRAQFDQMLARAGEGVTEADMLAEAEARGIAVEGAAPADSVAAGPAVEPRGGGVPDLFPAVAGAAGLATVAPWLARRVARPMARQIGEEIMNPQANVLNLHAAAARTVTAPLRPQPVERMGGLVAPGADIGRAPATGPGFEPAVGSIPSEEVSGLMPEEFEAPQRGSVESRMAEARAEKLEHDARKSRAQADAAEAKRDRDAAGRFKPDKGGAKSRIPHEGAVSPEDARMQRAAAMAEPSASNIRSLEKARGKAPKLEAVPGSAESRVIPLIKGKPPGLSTPDMTPGARHVVQYYSESGGTGGKGKFIPIETMDVPHLRNAVNKLHAHLTGVTKGRPAEATRKQFQALLDEITYRAQRAGELSALGPTGDKQNAAAVAFDEAAARAARGRGPRPSFPKDIPTSVHGFGKAAKGLAGKAKGVMAALPLILAMPEIARAEERERKAGVPENERVSRIVERAVGKLAAAVSPIGLDETAGKESEAPDIVEREFTR